MDLLGSGVAMANYLTMSNNSVFLEQWSLAESLIRAYDFSVNFFFPFKDPIRGKLLLKNVTKNSFSGSIFSVYVTEVRRS